MRIGSNPRFFLSARFYWSLFFLLIALEHQVDTWKSLKLMSRAFESTLLLSHYKIRESSCMMIFNLLSAMKITDEKNVNDALLSGSMMLFHFRLNNILFIRTGFVAAIAFIHKLLSRFSHLIGKLGKIESMLPEGDRPHLYAVK